MYLVDTNIWLERLLDQERSAEVGQFLSAVSSDRLLMTDFSLHSIGIILSRLGRADVLLRFVDDLFVEGGVTLVTVVPEMLRQVMSFVDHFGFDFDDAYQYVAAEQSGAMMVSYDSDFDRATRKRYTPLEIVKAENTD